MSDFWYLTEAHQGLDDTGNAVLGGASLAPDFAMRMVVAVRDSLNLHAPKAVGHGMDLGQAAWLMPNRPRRFVCAYDGANYPCKDVRIALSVLGIDPDAEED